MKIDTYLRKRNKLLREVKNLDVVYIMNNCKFEQGDIVDLRGEKIYIAKIRIAKGGRFAGLYHPIVDGKVMKEFKTFTYEDYKQIEDKGYGKQSYFDR